MSGAVAFLETIGLTPAMVAIDAMIKAAAVRILQVELNDLYGVCVKVSGAVADVQAALETGRAVAAAMSPQAVATVITQVSDAALKAIQSRPEYNPLIQQDVVFEEEESPEAGQTAAVEPKTDFMNVKSEQPAALGFIETQGFTAVFEAIDTACKAANVDVVGKEKLGGGYVTVVIQGELSAVRAAIDASKTRVEGLGKLIAAHVIARPSPAVLRLLPKL